MRLQCDDNKVSIYLSIYLYTPTLSWSSKNLCVSEITLSNHKVIQFIVKFNVVDSEGKFPNIRTTYGRNLKSNDWNAKISSPAAGATSFPGSLFSASLSRWNRALVAAGHVTTQNLGGRKISWKGMVFYRPLDQMYVSTHPPWGFRWIDGHVTSRNQGLCSND